MTKHYQKWWQKMPKPFTQEPDRVLSCRNNIYNNKIIYNIKRNKKVGIQLPWQALHLGQTYVAVFPPLMT